MYRMRMFALAALAAIASGACVGQFGGAQQESADGTPSGAAGTPREGSQVGPGASSVPGRVGSGAPPLRRLTHEEYNYTTGDLLGFAVTIASAFPPESPSQVTGFGNTAAELSVSYALAEAYMTAAETLAADAIKRLDALHPCDSSRDAKGCARSFVEKFGRRALRHPLTAAEITGWLAIYDAAASRAGYPGGVQAVIEAMLQSPHYLYRLEAPLAGTPEGPPLKAYELGNRLSYFLWASLPDAALVEAVDSGRLSSPAEVVAQARRMLGDPKARRTSARFFADWLELHLLDTVQKDAAAFPKFTSEIAQLMKREAELFVDEAFWRDGRLATLLRGSFTFTNDRLAQFVGHPAPGSTDFRRVELSSAQRAGVLTLPAVMALLAKKDQTSPVLRGKFVRERLLCQKPPPPPENADTTPPEPTAGKTARERFAAHSANPQCGYCHKLLDEVGFGLENYDAVGRWQTREGGVSIDARGELTATDVDGPFVGGPELATRLERSALFRRCIATQWFRFALGRAEQKSDEAALSLLAKAVTDASDQKEILVKLASGLLGGAP